MQVPEGTLAYKIDQGLSIAKWIVESHHGRVEVVSRPGGGSEFQVLLPLSAHPTRRDEVLRMCEELIGRRNNVTKV